MSASISLTFLPGAGAAKTKEIMTSARHIPSTVALIYTLIEIKKLGFFVKKRK